MKRDMYEVGAVRVRILPLPVRDSRRLGRLVFKHFLVNGCPYARGDDSRRKYHRGTLHGSRRSLLMSARVRFITRSTGASLSTRPMQRPEISCSTVLKRSKGGGGKREKFLDAYSLIAKRL